MNNIKHKLRSKSGATVILALVFLLFCMFVGGSVLAAGAANGFRTKQTSKQIEELKLRSAANLVSQQLNPGEDAALQLTITDVVQEKYPCNTQGAVTSTTPISSQRKVVVKLSGKLDGDGNVAMTELQRLAAETAVWRYLKLRGITNSSIVTLEDFPGATGTGQFYYQYTLTGNQEISGIMALTGTLSGGTQFGQISASFVCREDYDFFVTVGTGDYITVEMEAISQPNSNQSTVIEANSSSTTGYAKTTTTTEQTVILWSAPTVEKEG